MISIFKSINYIWRVLATGIAFSVFGHGGLFLTFAVFPAQLLFIRDLEKKKKVIRSTISFAFKFFMYFMHYLGLLRFHKKNIEALKSDKGCLLIANHPTLIDVVSIIAYTPNACCIINRDLMKNFYIKRVLRAAGYIPNEDADVLLEKCKESLNNGDILVVFPEGTRTKIGQEPVFQRGAAHIALMLNCPVRCVEISCNPITLTKGQPWYNIPERRTDFSLEVKDIIHPFDYIDKETPRPKAARQLNRLFLKQYCLNTGPVLK